ncbi:MAG: 30S ribosome-binding factor RbfA [Leptospiraceae bacterium]|nr:30S ribosome-binding factor RbfA [Leptospiraceae bacterium]
MDPIRKKKIESEIIKTLSNLFVSGKVKDPRIGIVSLHRAELAEDLTKVKIWVTSYIEEKQKGKFLSALKNASGFFQKVIADELRLRNTPRIHFIWDENFIKSLKVNELIDSLSDQADKRESETSEEE